MKRMVVAIILLVLPHLNLVAQKPAEAAMRVRVYVEGQRKPIVGNLPRVQEEAVSLHLIGVDHQPIFLDREHVRAIDMSMGRNRAPWIVGGAATGILAGTVAGGLLAPRNEPEDVTEAIIFPLVDAVVAGRLMLIGAGVGLLLGGIAGASIAPERWRPLPLSETLGLYVSPSGSLVVRLGR